MVKFFKIIQILYEYLIDILLLLIFNRYSFLANKRNRLNYNILINAHSIEKGLSLEKPKHLFGKKKIKYLIKNLSLNKNICSTSVLEMACGALNEYYELNKKFNDPIILKLKNFLKSNILIKKKGGTIITKFNKNYFKRKSSRIYRNKIISKNKIEKIINLSKYAPSQCNRQSSKVHVFQNTKLIRQILKIQGGANSFTNQIKNIFIVTSDINAWGGPGERNQLYIDGSLFAMNLLNSCNYFGLLSCPLNLDISNFKEFKIKKLSKIPLNERLIMIIAFGYSKNMNLKNAYSLRKKNHELLNFHN